MTATPDDPELEQIRQLVEAQPAAHRYNTGVLMARLEQERTAMTAPEHPDRPHSRGLPVRNVRLDNERWTRITAEAARTNATASDVIRAAIDAHLEQQA